MKVLDISSELERTYHYTDGYTIRIILPQDLFISDSGTHRVFNGLTVTYVPEGWRKLTWLPASKARPVAF